MAVELTQEQVEAVMGPVKALIEAKVAEAQLPSSSPLIYSEEDKQQFIVAAKAEEKARLKAAWESKNAEQDAAVVAEIFA